MDEKTRNMDETAQQEKEKIKKEIEVQRKKVYEDYIEKAHIRAQKNDAIAQQQAQKRFEENKARNIESMKELQKTFDNNCDRWVDEIVRRVVQ